MSRAFGTLTVLEALRQVGAPIPIRLIYLDVSDAERNRRLRAEGVSAGDGEEWEEHSTEYDVLNRLSAAADLTVDADMPPDFVAKTVLDWLAGG